MENGIEAYSMLLERPWLKQAKVHHNQGNNTFIITSKGIMVMLNTIKRVNIKSSQLPKILDNEFDQEEGFFEQKQEKLYITIPKLWPIKKVAPK